MSDASYTAINQNADKKDESYEKIVIAKIGASVSAFFGVPASASEVEIVGSGSLTKSHSKVKINVLVDLSACGGTFFMRIYNDREGEF